jgi:hypothetical protein
MFRSILKWGGIGLAVLIVIGALFGDSGKATAEAPATETAEAAPAKEATKPKATPDTSEKLDKALEDFNKTFAGDEDKAEEDKAEEEWEAPADEQAINGDDEDKAEEEAPADEPAKPAKPAKPSMTRGQENAIEKAESYIDLSGFSKVGLLKQLKFEQFSNADARYAVNHVDVNWNTEAVQKAESYLDTTSFSAGALADQLEFEGFTPAQVQHAVEKVY